MESDKNWHKLVAWVRVVGKPWKNGIFTFMVTIKKRKKKLVDAWSLTYLKYNRSKPLVLKYRHKSL